MTTLRTAEDLIAAGLVPEADRADLSRVAARYAVAVTPNLAGLMAGPDRTDAIARQFLPDVAELDILSQELADPIGDNAFSPVKGLVHRYPDRVLLKVVGVCAVYCRFCFRREMVGPGAETTLSEREIDAALDYVRQHREIWEVILTGGDPFMVSPRRMQALAERLGAMEHVHVLRLHTRVPIAAPERVTAELVSSLRAEGITPYVAVHVNHAREMTAEARAAIARMVDAGIPVLSQTVLLRGVNDHADTLAALFRALVANRVKPYYLHHPDLAPGTSHFRLGVSEGQSLVAQLRGRISGLCMPTYVLDIPGGHGKAPLESAVERGADGNLSVRDRDGRVHPYPDGP
ncbi:lysine-2,3-aminomutase-like protein [Aquabacter sp. L1I39]|uniref:lysine-2,3-aminomutase-like protein n=1 Tax=Aquabacter sp. L1I39 TaxID=2820278 RepID=UPI001ADA0F37|nr:lysine-2,3-aminomutase-like protein [Aquabacter sp. L1I39]QTL01787.1 lysine-2,3-aminomutase-like protein [Aquabacter sp. L1I39]